MGRSAQDYLVNPDAGYALAYDIGGTKILAVLLDLSGLVVCQTQISTAPEGGLVVVDQIVTLAQELFMLSGKDPEKLKAMVLGVPCVPDPVSGRVRLATNIKDWDGLDLRGAIQSAFPDCAIRLENDVKLAAIGEKQYAGASLGQTFGFLNVGTGISLGIILDGKIIHGATGASGEIGLMPLIPSGDSNQSRYNSQLEPAVGSVGLVQRYNAGSPNPIPNVKELFTRSAWGDERALTLLDETAYFLSLSLLCIKACIDLNIFVFGGSIGMQDDLLRRVEGHLRAQGDEEIRLERSQLDNKAGIYGTATLAVQMLIDTLFHYTPVGEAIPDPIIYPDAF